MDRARKASWVEGGSVFLAGEQTEDMGSQMALTAIARGSGWGGKAT